MKKQVIILILLMVLSCSLASAKTYHITLLTIGEAGEGTFGGTANAYLDVKYGNGRIFLDSFPLTKLDTQISTRYANEIACDYLNRDCSHYDFYYTIRADSTIVGGPSASASLTVLTIAALQGLKLRNDTVMTGTINSGGSIGPVGGIVKKAMAAQENGFKRVLVPVFSFELDEVSNETSDMNETNQTITIVNQTRNNENASISKSNESNITNATKKELTLEEANLTIEVIRISNIEEALAYFTNTTVKQTDEEIQVPDEYTSIMKSVSESLCNRAFELNKRVKLVNESEINKSSEFLTGINKTMQAQDYYSTASYCFSLAVLLRKANLKEVEKANPYQIKEIHRLTKKAVEEFDKSLEKVNITTLSELETYIIVKERLLEAESSLMKMENNISSDELAYALERYYSGVYWSNFFKLKGQRMQLDKEYLKRACYKKLSEADERNNYAGLYIPMELQGAKETMVHAYAFAAQENYKMCLFKASFAKAESNLLLSTLAIRKNQVDELAEEKLKAAKKVIVKEQSRGIFPIMGYSYYEYANSLKENNDALSGLIFSEYALELSNIEIYFPKKGFELPGWLQLFRINQALVLFFASALLFGIGIGIAIGTRIRIHPTKKRRKK